MMIEILQALGVRFNGFRGLDRFTRLCHNPYKRQKTWIGSYCNAKWDGPKYLLETRYYTEWMAFFFGSQDPRIHYFIKKNSCENWVSIDIGANYGFYTILLAHSSPKGMVHSFEPVPWLNARMLHNAKINGLTNIIPNEMVLSNSTGCVNLHVPSDDDPNQGTATIWQNHGAGPRKIVTVKSVTLSEYVKERRLEKLDFIKIDVEGAEDLVIEGGIDAIKQFRPILIIEKNISSFAEVDRILRSCGYESHNLPRVHWPLFFNEPDTDVLYLPKHK